MLHKPGENIRSEKSDLRIKKTHSQLWNAVVELSIEKGFDKISVNDICSRAMINRSTFYRHFEDKFDLLLRKTDEILYEMADSADSPDHVAEQQDFSEYEKFLRFISDYRVFFRLMLGENGNQQFTGRIYNYLLDVTRDRLKQWPLNLEDPPLPLDLLIHYISGAHLSLIRWWVTNDIPCSIEELTIYNVKLFTTDPLSLLGLDDEILKPLRNI